MTIPGYVDRQKGKDRVKANMLTQFGADYEPPGGWDAFFGPDDPVKDVQCQSCGEWVPEIRPFGKNHESICEQCAAKDMDTTMERYYGLNPGKRPNATA